MTQSNNNFLYSYEDECISYKSLFPVFSREDFNELDKTFSQLNIDDEIKKLFSEYKINTTEDQAALHHVYSCLLYTSPSPRDYAASRMPSSA